MSESQARTSGPEREESATRQDRSLMQRLHAGDTSALEELLDRYWDPLVAYATRLLSDGDAAEDVVQDAMLRVWKGRDRWTPSERLQGFLYQVTRNLALNERDKRRVRRNWAESAKREPPEAPEDPHNISERAQLRALLDRVVEELPERRREIFILARYHGHSYREISKIMDISPQTVANQMSSALDELRRKLRPQIDAFVTVDALRPLGAESAEAPDD